MEEYRDAYYRALDQNDRLKVAVTKLEGDMARIAKAAEYVCRGVLQGQDYHAGGLFAADVDDLLAMVAVNKAGA